MPSLTHHAISALCQESTHPISGDTRLEHLSNGASVGRSHCEVIVLPSVIGQHFEDVTSRLEKDTASCKLAHGPSPCPGSL